jgi:hypothetical protein
MLITSMLITTMLITTMLITTTMLILKHSEICNFFCFYLFFGYICFYSTCNATFVFKIIKNTKDPNLENMRSSARKCRLEFGHPYSFIFTKTLFFSPFDISKNPACQNWIFSLNYYQQSYLIQQKSRDIFCRRHRRRKTYKAIYRFIGFHHGRCPFISGQGKGPQTK